MKVAQLLPDIPNLGGLATRTYEQHKIFNSIKNVESDFFKITKKLKNSFEPKKLELKNTQYGLSLSQYEVSYNSKVIKETIKKLNEYDILWFNHACPHINTEGEKDAELWMNLYTETKPKKVTIISDVYFEKYYPWLLNVASSITTMLGIGHGHANSVANHFKVDGILKHPFLFEDHKYLSNAKRKGILWAHQWRAWKGIETYLELCTMLQEPTTFYGAGMEYYMIRKENPKLFEKAIGKDSFSDVVWNAVSKNEIKGTAHSSEVLQAYQSAKAAVDFTCVTGSKKYRGHYNRATLEPMLYGCVVITTPFLVEPYTHIPRECVLVAEKSKNEMAKEINATLSDSSLCKKIANKAFDWIHEEHEGKKILKSWLDYTLKKTKTISVSSEYQNGVIRNKGNGIKRFLNG